MQPFYILHPRFEWQVWQRIQDNMAEPIQKNPPSSGLLGKHQHPVYNLLITHPVSHAHFKSIRRAQRQTERTKETKHIGFQQTR